MESEGPQSGGDPQVENHQARGPQICGSGNSLHSESCCTVFYVRHLRESFRKWDWLWWKQWVYISVKTGKKGAERLSAPNHKEAWRQSAGSQLLLLT